MAIKNNSSNSSCICFFPTSEKVCRTIPDRRFVRALLFDVKMLNDKQNEELRKGDKGRNLGRKKGEAGQTTEIISQGAWNVVIINNSV